MSRSRIIIMEFPQIIQGGMGAGVSDWPLARAVSLRGQTGVVSGTALDLIFIRRLQLGDPDGHMRRALAAFPDQDVSRRLIERYFIEGGKDPDQSFIDKPVVGHKRSRQVDELLVAANFVEVFLAKEGHDGMVGINFLQKIQAPLLPSIYGAMLAGVDIVVVGAGIPLEIPAILDNLSRSQKAEQKLHVLGATSGHVHKTYFDPREVLDNFPSSIRRPHFFPVVASVTLAALLVKKCPGGVDGLIIEGPTAGGHNAPPRGKAQFSPEGEPLYGSRDEVDLAAIKALGLPFWLAGSYGSPEKLAEARDAGATGIQVGTLFAFCQESGLRKDLKDEIVGTYLNGTLQVKTDPLASPTGFPFKLLSLPGTLSEDDVYSERCRQCDLGYLREAYERDDGSVAWRCLAEHPDTFVRRGGKREDTVGRRCLCNGLMANIGLAQIRSDHYEELPLVTCGDDLSGISQILTPGETSYNADDVIDFLLEPHSNIPAISLE